MWPPKLYPEDPNPTPPMFTFEETPPPQAQGPESGVYWNCYTCGLNVTALDASLIERRNYSKADGTFHCITYCSDCVRRFLHCNNL